jgi:hypothetical protein
MAGEQLYGFQKIGGMKEMLKSPAIKMLPLRSCLQYKFCNRFPCRTAAD